MTPILTNTIDDEEVVIPPEGAPVLNYPKLVFDIGVAHGGSLEKAKKIVDCVKDEMRNWDELRQGCVIKTQMFNPKKLATATATFQSGKKQLPILLKNSLTPTEHVALIKYIRDSDLQAGVTCFTLEDVDYLYKKTICPDLIKIASPDIIDWPLIMRAAWKIGISPFVISTGGATIHEIARLALFMCENVLVHPDGVTLLHCCSMYPAEDFSYPIWDWIKRFCINRGFRFGLSDHSQQNDNRAARFAIQEGASLIERHFGLGNNTPDKDVELTPKSLPKFLEVVHNEMSSLRCSLGFTFPLPRFIREDRDAVMFTRKYLVATRRIKEGESLILGKNVRFMRVGCNHNEAITPEHWLYMTATDDHKEVIVVSCCPYKAGEQVSRVNLDVNKEKTT